ncbi:SDR family oxidoreductase [Candidatus Albibeggiatoa sp. nov. BB20]|uniref:SDR family oxidoreductase n=1 Tax=Candidatus Albibeggiatoa sp. nov. BB20 TaxID=3162723 RepID=UPI0033656DF5
MTNQSTDTEIELGEFFNQEWTIYRKVVDLNLLSHKEIAATLKQFLITPYEQPISLLDLGCGDALIPSQILVDVPISSYTGVDLSSFALSCAKKNMVTCHFEKDFVEGNLTEVVAKYQGKFDVIIAGYSIHHLSLKDKQSLFISARKALKQNGYFLIYDAVCESGEKREDYLKRHWGMYKHPKVTEAEHNLIYDHLKSDDYPESLETLAELANSSGFQSSQSLFWDKHKVFNLSVFTKATKTALVTGGNSGIGYATANLLKEQGYEVTISGRNPKKLEKAADELGANKILADLSDPEDIKKLASHFLKDGLDVLVNNAGIPMLMPITDITADNFNDIFNINVRGPLLLIQELLPALEKREGSVCSVSSVVATAMGTPGISLYAATKGAVNAFTLNLAIELAPRNIRINAVAPGPIDTPIFMKTGFDSEQAEELKKAMSSKIPMERLGTPEEVAEIILAQLESTYVTGAVWVVDGGVSVA